MIYFSYLIITVAIIFTVISLRRSIMLKNKIIMPAINRIMQNQSNIEKTNQTPDIVTSAVLIKKSQEIRPRGYASISICIFVFELPSGERKVFRVESAVYYMFDEGDEGTLTYKELNDTRVFVSFQPVR